MKKLIYILGVIILCVTSSLVTFFTLSSLHIIDLKEKIELEVAIENISKEYDGKALSANNYTYSGDLQEGHVLDVDYLGSQLEVGTATSNANVRVLELSTGADVSELYELSVKPGLIQILPREITILFDSDMKYSGPTIAELDYQISNGSLVVGDEMVVQYTGEVSEIGQLQVSNELLNILLYNSAGHNVTNNYHITYQVRNLNIIKRDLVIKPYPYQKIYDGKKFKVDSYEMISGSLLEGHRIAKVEYNLNHDNVGTYAEQTLNVQIQDIVGNDVTSYYNINPNLTFDLEILPKDIEVKLPKLIFPNRQEALIGYTEALTKLSNLDGVFFTLDNEFTLENSSSVQEITEQDIEISGVEAYNYHFNFINGEIEIKREIQLPTLTIPYTDSAVNETYDSKIPTIEGITIRLAQDKQYIDAGTYEITEKELEIDGESIGLSFINGSITITPKEVAFSSSPIEHPYNGSKFEIKDNELQLNSSDGVLEQDYFVKNVVLDSYEVTEDRILNSFVGKVLEYQIYNSSGKNVTSNFTVTTNSIYCKFLRSSLELQMKDISGIYFETKSYQLADLITDYYKNKIAQGDYIQNITMPIQFVDTTTLDDIQTNLKNQIKIVNAAGKDVTFAYNVSILTDQAKFNIEKRPAKIILPAYQNMYDGTIHTFADITTDKIQYDGFVNGDQPQPTSDESWQNVGVYTYQCDYDPSLDLKYDISIVSGTVTITKRKAQIILPNYEKEYDGTDLTFTDATSGKIEYIGFINEDTPVLTSDKKWTVAGTYSYVGSWDEAYDVNYEISLVSGTITIARKKAQIILPNHEKEYDATALTFAKVTEGKIEYIGFVNDVKPVIGSDKQWVEAGTYSYVGSWDEAYDANYDITMVPGTITIAKKKAQIILPNYEKEYDGTDLTFTDATSGKIEYIGFINEDKPVIVSNKKWTVVGTYSYIGSWDAAYDTNYSITMVPGTVTITRKKAQIKLPNHEKEYDGIALSFTDLPTASIEFTGFIIGEKTPKINCADKWKEVGTYSYSGTWEAAFDANYDITMVPGTIKITRKKAQIELKNYAMEYNGTVLTFADLPAASINCTGFLEDDLPTMATLTCNDQWLNAGSYSYTCQWPTTYNKNYEITVIPGIITINKASFAIPSATITHVYNGSYYEVYDDELSFILGEKNYYLRNVKIESVTRITYLSTMAVKFKTTGYSIYTTEGEDVTNNFDNSIIELDMRFKAKTINYYIPDFNVGTYGDDVTISPITMLKGFENNLHSSEYLEISETGIDLSMDWTTCKVNNLADLSSCISISAQFTALSYDVIVDGVYDITIVNEETFKPSFNRRKAQIIFGDYEMIHTGGTITYADIADRTYCLGFLAQDLPITFTCTDSWTDVGTYQYCCTWDENLNLYYDISVTIGTIRITN